MNFVIAGAIYTLIALGFNMIYRITKFFNVAHGAFLVIGGYIVFFLHVTHGWNLYVSSVVSVLSVGLLGMLLDRAVFARLRKKGASSVVMLVASLGTLWAIQALITLIFGTEFLKLSGNGVIPQTYSVTGAVITEVHIIIVISGFLMTALLYYIRRTKFGKTAKAIGDDEEVAKIIGINTDMVIGYVFFIGSAVAALGGILIGFDVGLLPAMGMLLLLKGVTASIIGGVGNMYGAVVGAYLLGLVENTGAYILSSAWQDAIAFGLLILFLLFRPTGILKA
jgi:branched-chain amino acid transport system permease protein